MGLGAKQGCNGGPTVGASPIDLVIFPGLAVQVLGQFLDLMKEMAYRRSNVSVVLLLFIPYFQVLLERRIQGSQLPMALGQLVSPFPHCLLGALLLG